MLVADPWHWLDKNGDLPADNARLRRQVLRAQTEAMRWDEERDGADPDAES
jgi:hypothetical protein